LENPAFFPSSSATDFKGCQVAGLKSLTGFQYAALQRFPCPVLPDIFVSRKKTTQTTITKYQ
jgi:hypothetical protein